MASHSLATAKTARSSSVMMMRWPRLPRTTTTSSGSTSTSTSSMGSIRRTVATKTKPSAVIQATNMPLNQQQLFITQQQRQQQHSSTSRRQQHQLKQQMSVLAVTPEDAMLYSSSSSSIGEEDSNNTAATTSSSNNNGMNLNLTGDAGLPQDLDEVDMKELERIASLTPTPLRLGDMYKYGGGDDLEQRLRNAQFLHRELPIRLAQRAFDLLSLPHGLSSESTPIRQVALIYIQHLHEFKNSSPPKTQEEEDAFTEVLHRMVLDRTTIPTAIARGLAEWLDDDRREDLELERQQEMEDALVRFFTARTGLRFLTEHHILSSPNPKLAGIVQQTQSSLGTNERTQMRGCIQKDCDPVLECQKVAEEVARQTYDCYGMCPEIEIVDRQSPNANVFTYVPHHLHYMLSELLKNSCRASVERYVEQGGPKSPMAKLPEVRVVIVKGAQEVTIKVADKGGGIPRSTMSRIFKFTHSTSKQDEENTDFGTVEAGIRHMRGFGLPLARIYARYFGGELTLKSMEGYGLDAYLYLPRLGDACESLPPRVSASPGELVSLPNKKKKKKTSENQSKTSATTSSSGTSSASGTTSKSRTFSTMIPRTYYDQAMAAQQPIQQYSSVEPWVMGSGEMADNTDWEEAKIRRILRVLKSRAL